MDFYDRHAAAYAAHSLARDLAFLWEPFCRALPPRSRVLDLGSGAGRDSLTLAARGFDVVSLDRSMGMLRQHRERGGQTLIRGDLAWLPFRPASFAGIWACASLLHLPKARILFALHEAHRVLMPEGLLFLSVKAGTGEFADEEGRFWALYQEDELIDLATIAGFRSVECGRSADLAGRPDVAWINLWARSCG
ncbi:MAG: Methyltransferase [Candidatus Ozemobacter sibiricus]|uniref:Methyltransferase n=1 Tax=Candidatus Ozemobacter sibiricus TaxID=2268124 RepID=A0A367ZF44_9BACT|nr:MAG: Methyltransferase [Candidatus Ozemobacter sibiricus]